MTRSLKNEVWKPVDEEWGHIYMVSNLGRVKMRRRKVKHRDGGFSVIKSQLMSCTLDKNGYNVCTYRSNNIKKFNRVHRIVAKAFIQNTENKPYINHIDGIKNNNRVENLEWCTPKENVVHSIATFGRTYLSGANHPLARPVKCTTLDIVFDSATDAARQLDVSQTNISCICRGGRLNHTKGLTFIFI